MNAIKDYFLNIFVNHYCDFKECSSRTEFFCFIILWITFCLVLGIVLFVAKLSVETILIVLGMICILSFLPFLSLIVRRLHDAGFRAAFLFLLLLGPVGLFVIFIFTLMPTYFHNKYVGRIEMSAMDRTLQVILTSIVAITCALFIYFTSKLKKEIDVLTAYETIETDEAQIELLTAADGILQIEFQSDGAKFMKSRILSGGAVNEYQIAARVKDALEQYKLGQMYYKGIGAEKDIDKAYLWFLSAADLGNKDAYEMAQFIALKDKGNLPGDYQALNITALEGDPDAQYMMAIMFDLGLGVKEDKNAATDWFESAFIGYYSLSIDIINDEAQCKIGDMYFWGLGVEENKELAAKWYKRSALLRNTDALYNLAKMTETSAGGIRKNPKEALKLYERAAMQGSFLAQKKMNLIDDNWGVSINENELRAADKIKKRATKKEIERVIKMLQQIRAKI
ncbi:MAG: DUF805 domain-containing protein [Elusimicrobiota bacterium]|jgi:uncharacterized membrane protein YhaH (DUF805 family)|nr:DUF805 domain-containing protein [Elusimicrobiota bacterium]